MIRIHGIKLTIHEDPSVLNEKISRRLHISTGSFEIIKIAKESLDAREKPVLWRVFSVDIAGFGTDDPLKKACKRAGVQYSEVCREEFDPRPIVFKGGPCEYDMQSAEMQLPGASFRPVIAGFGPCGMFAALALAEYGLRPVVVERGGRMDERIAAVETFWRGGNLDPECNVQFGEGGAGTFSDGKLTTGTKSPYSAWILKQLVNAGAAPEILYKQKPHVGTDVLRSVVVNIRKRIEALGGEVLFGCRLEGLDINFGKVCGAVVSNKEDTGRSPVRTIKTDTMILALGHSARDTVRMLFGQGLRMEQKPFSMGVRIEHPQDIIDMAQYGADHRELGIGPADYKLNVRTGIGRGVYTFCMCPGGYVINSSSAEGMITTNGMSNSDRSSGIANSALLVDVLPSDYSPKYLPKEIYPNHPLAGMTFQEKYERLAFELGGGNYSAPVQTVGSFLRGSSENANEENEKSIATVSIGPCATDASNETGTSSVSIGTDIAATNKRSNKETGSYAAPSFRPGTCHADLRKCLPDFIAESLAESLPALGRKLKGFDSPDALMTAIESRSSSPVRIIRDPATLEGVFAHRDQTDKSGQEDSHSKDLAIIQGLYPAGEGAGYAGGIMSAAADGVKIAVKIAEKIKKQ